MYAAEPFERAQGPLVWPRLGSVREGRSAGAQSPRLTPRRHGTAVLSRGVGLLARSRYSLGLPGWMVHPVAASRIRNASKGPDCSQWRVRAGFSPASHHPLRFAILYAHRMALSTKGCAGATSRKQRYLHTASPSRYYRSVSAFPAVGPVFRACRRGHPWIRRLCSSTSGPRPGRLARR